MSRTGVHISTTRLATTLTTRGRTVVALDASQPNDAFNLRSQLGQPFAAVGWLFREPPREGHRLGFRALGISTRLVLPKHRLWLLAAHSAPQPNTATSRHRRIWGSLLARGINLPGGARTQEFVSASEGGLRWAGGLALREAADLDAALDLIHAEPATLVVALDAALEREVEAVLKKGWSSSPGLPPSEILEWMVGREAVIFFPVGAFDDPESGVVGLGPRRLIEQLGAAHLG